MKYIRTKDRIYDKEKCCIVKQFVKFSNEWISIKKQANTIEELCDEFVGVWTNYYEKNETDAHEKYYYDKEKNVFFDDFEKLTHKEAIEKFDVFYGAIWTDKGLIYVAKMNEKGELELL